MESNEKDREIEFANIKAMLSKISSDVTVKSQETNEELANKFYNANFPSSPNDYSFDTSVATLSDVDLNSIIGPPTCSINNGVTYSPYSFNTTSVITSAISTNMAGTLQLQGENADIIINGVSMSKRLDKICERLNILTPNATLEKEWDQLRELGEQYRALETKLKEQGDMWGKLKSMPKPEL